MADFKLSRRRIQGDCSSPVNQLRGISRTAPYFHNNSAATLEDVLDHYDARFRQVARLNPPPNLPPILSSDGLVVDRGFVTAEERPALLAYLRKQ